MSATVTWPVFQTGLLNRETVAERTMSFRFAKPADGSYPAGQFVDLTPLDPPETDAEGNTRGFSISSAPREDVITITNPLARSGLQARAPALIDVRQPANAEPSTRAYRRI